MPPVGAPSNLSLFRFGGDFMLERQMATVDEAVSPSTETRVADAKVRLCAARSTRITTTPDIMNTYSSPNVPSHPATFTVRLILLLLSLATSPVSLAAA